MYSSLHFRPRFAATALFCSLGLLSLRASAQDFEARVKEASPALSALQKELGPMVIAGRVDEANKKVLAFYPKESRTPLQAYLLANTLYELDPKSSYALHKEAALKLPDEPAVQLEWAMEQHRAGEYAGALASYDAFSAKRPQFAPVHGLASDCLIRLNRTKDAVARWEQSEKATGGSLETLESFVCDIYKDLSPRKKRPELIKKATGGDIGSAVALIAGDGDFRRDWWNRGPQREYLAFDQTLLSKLPASARLKAAQCVCECSMLEEPKKDDLRKIMLQYGFLVDDAKTLPEDGELASLLLGLAFDSGLIQESEAKEQFAGKLLAKAKASKNAALWNIVAFLSIDQAGMGDVEKEAWDATGDQRFAVGYLVEMMKQKTLKADDPLLAKAMKQFPEQSEILIMKVAVSEPDEALLVRGIKAEFHHFSIMPGLSARPGAKFLVSYFHRLAALEAKK